MKYTDKLRAMCRPAAAVIAASLLFAACDNDEETEKRGPGPDPEPETELSFACDVTDITASSARVIVSPTDGYTGYYYFDVMEKTEFETQYADNLQVLADRFEAMVQETADRYIEAGQGSSIEELMESAIASQGIADYEYQTLNPLTDYCVWACGVDLQGKVTSDISVIKEFTTLDVEHSGMTFDIA